MADEENEIEYADPTPMGSLESFIRMIQDEADALASIVLVAEFVKADGTPQLCTWGDGLSGPWKHDGMLRWGIRHISEEQGEFEYEYEEEEED